MSFEIREMTSQDAPNAVALQRLCFPAPFPEHLLWSEEHLQAHLRLFPIGQFVAHAGPAVVGTASNTRISHTAWEQRLNWSETVGGPFLERFDPSGDLLFGLDISVHPDWRMQGVARALYEARFTLVRRLGLKGYAAGCRLPGYADRFGHSQMPLTEYVERVQEGQEADPTLSPLLRIGLTVVGVAQEYMEDDESLGCAALLEWKP